MANKPNIVFVLTDDQGYGELGCHGNEIIKTPNVDKLYAESTRFANFHVAPTCAPSRAQLMTGKHEFRVGVTHTILGRERLASDAITLAEVLEEAGYKTGLFGKWHLGDQFAYTPDKRGFHEVLVHGAGGLGQVQYGDHPGNKENPYFDPVVYENGKFVRKKGYCNDIWFDSAINWIEKNQDEPFFAYIATNLPHTPLLVPDSYSDTYEKYDLIEGGNKYYGMITHIDDKMGELMISLERMGLKDNTLLIFMTDNGHAIGGPTKAGHDRETGYLNVDGLYNANMRGGKGQPWEGGTRVPCFFRWPGQFPQGTDKNQIAGGIDLLPTLAEICGAEIPEDIDGKSLLPLLKDANAEWPDRFLVTHVGRWGKGKAADSKYDKCAIRSQLFRFINNVELHDMRNDPEENTNVIDKYPEVVSQMREFYDNWWEQTLPCMINE